MIGMLQRRNRKTNIPTVFNSIRFFGILFMPLQNTIPVIDDFIPIWRLAKTYAALVSKFL